MEPILYNNVKEHVQVQKICSILIYINVTKS